MDGIDGGDIIVRDIMILFQRETFCLPGFLVALLSMEEAGIDQDKGEDEAVSYWSTELSPVLPLS